MFYFNMKLICFLSIYHFEVKTEPKHLKLWRVNQNNIRSSQSSCTGTKIQQFLKYKKLSYICIENIKIIIVCEHKKMYDGTIYD